MSNRQKYVLPADVPAQPPRQPAQSADQMVTQANYYAMCEIAIAEREERRRRDILYPEWLWGGEK